MESQEIENICREIEQIGDQTDSLESQLAQYENMNRQIQNAISELEVAKKYMEDAYEQLKVSYSGNEANDQYQICEDILQEIVRKISELEKQILPASDNKIVEIHSMINSNNRRLRELSNMLS